MILVTHGREVPELLKEIAHRKNFPVLRTNMKTSFATLSLTNFLDEQLAESTIIHGELVRVYGVGVLITGTSGMGKSEIALELIKKGHQIVADDRVDCYLIHNELIGRTPELLQGFMEMRGIGVINVSRMFGVGALSNEAKITLHIHLEPFNDNQEYDRVGIEEKETSEFLGIKISRINIPVSPGRPMSAIIETAVMNHMLTEAGKDPAKEFEERALKQIEDNQLAYEQNEDKE